MNKYEVISNVTRITFFAGLIIILLLMISLIPDISGWANRTDAQKKPAQKKLYIMLAIALIVIASAFIGSRTYAKI